MKKSQMVIFWSLNVAALIGLFWLVWSQIVGPVPKITGITLIDTYQYTFDTPISRWWDVAIGLIWGAMFGIFYANKKVVSKILPILL